MCKALVLISKPQENKLTKHQQNRSSSTKRLVQVYGSSNCDLKPWFWNHEPKMYISFFNFFSSGLFFQSYIKVTSIYNEDYYWYNIEKIKLNCKSCTIQSLFPIQASHKHKNAFIDYHCLVRITFPLSLCLNYNYWRFTCITHATVLRLIFNINEIAINSKAYVRLMQFKELFFYFSFCWNKDRNKSDTQTEVKIASTSVDKSDLFPLILLADGHLFFYSETCCYK